jgi:hypothetical protein
MQPPMQPNQPPNKETEYALRNRTIRAGDLQAGKVDLNWYPHRYLVIFEYHTLGQAGTGAVLATVEWLEQYGWELVDATWTKGETFSVLVRRIQGRPQDT